MPEEYLDIVDKNGNPTGEKEFRSVVHKKGLWHRTVHIYFYRIKNGVVEILVHLRSKFKDQKPNVWDTRFGGHIIAGQVVEDAVLKEAREETGIKIKPEYLLKGKTEKYNGGKNKEFVSVYYYDFKGSINDIIFDDGEVQKVKWMNEFEIVKSMRDNSKIWTGKGNTFRKIIKELRSKI